jgi:hypothetical protein
MIFQWGRVTSYFAGGFAAPSPFGGARPSSITPVFISSTAQVFEPTFLGGGSTATALFINGVGPISYMTHPGGDPASTGLSGATGLTAPQITRILGQRGSFVFAVLSSNIGFVPQAYQEVVFYRRGKRRFGGFITIVSDTVIQSTALRQFGVTCVDYNGYLDRVVIAKLYTISTGSLISIIIADFVNSFLGPDFGITYTFAGDPFVAIPQILFHYVTMQSAVTQLLRNASGWYVNIDDYKVLTFRQQGASPAAPYSLSDTSRNWQTMSATQQNSEYRNRQWVLPSVNTQSFQVDSFTGDGSTTSFITQYVLTATPVVAVSGTVQNVLELSQIGSGKPYDWYWILQGQGVFQKASDTPLGIGVSLTVTYPAPFQLAVMAENASEIARVGLVEAIEQPTDLIDQTTAENLAAALLANYCPSVPSQIEFITNEIIEATAGGWVETGSLLTSSTTAPLTSGAYLVQEIDSTEIDLTFWQHHITARLQNGATDYQSVLSKLTQQALSAANNNNQTVLVFELAVTISGITNPGLATGVPPNVQINPKPGVISAWKIIFPTTPPQGADILIDIKQNGTSIFASGVYVDLPAGQTTEEDGNYFNGGNVKVLTGDLFTLNVVQVGSTTPGSDGVLQLIILN